MQKAINPDQALDHVLSAARPRPAVTLSQARRAGVALGPVCRAEDTARSLAAALEAASVADLVVLTGGVSMGRYDLVPAALAGHGVEVLFHKVTQMPGKPLLVGRSGERLFFGLPGHPLASHLCFDRYVLAAARQMAGLPGRAPVYTAPLAAPVHRHRERSRFVPTAPLAGDGGLAVLPLEGAGSADIFAKQGACGYLRVEPGEGRMEPGERVPFQLFGALP